MTDPATEQATRPIPKATRDHLYEIFRTDGSFDQKAQGALALGKEYLGAESGQVTRIDRETDRWEAMVTTDKPEGCFPPDSTLDLETTYCRHTIGATSQVIINDATNQGMADHQAYRAHGLESYLGTSLIIDGEPYGTVSFVAGESRNPYDDDEVMLVELIGQLLERELEADHHEAQLTRQANLATVLNRVLRHNLKNDMSIVRGYTQIMAEELGNPPYTQHPINSIDRLLNLSDKARELDQFITADFKRTPTEITGLVDRIVNSIHHDYPDAFITVGYDKEITAVVFPSLERGLYELIENAAKHGGNPANVTITVDAMPYAVEIQIEDDGPGLETQEAAVLRSGSETPLIHGSGLGLWLARWIITSHGGSLDVTSIDHGTTLSVSIPRNPTANVKAELAELTQARDQYKAAFERSRDAMIIVNDDARIIDANRKAAGLYGMDEQDLLGQSLTRFFPDDFDFDAFWRKSHEKGTDMDTMVIQGADGINREVEYSAANKIVPGQTLIVSRDITDRQNRISKIEQQDQQIRDITDSVEVALWLRHPEDGYLFMNQYHRDLFGTDTDTEVVGKTFQELLPEDIAATLQANDEQARETGHPIEVLEELQVDAGSRTFLIRITPLCNDEGEFYATCGVATDITDQSEQKQKLDSKRRQYRSLIEVLPHGVYRADPDTLETTFANRAFKQIHGYTVDTWPSDPTLWKQSIHPDDATRVQQAFRSHRESRTSGQLEYRIQTADGQTRWVEDTFQWEYDDEGDVTALVGVYTDISERKKQHTELRERNREFTALRQMTELFAGNDDSIETIVKQLTENLQEWFEHTEPTEARVCIGDIEVTTDEFHPDHPTISSTAETQDGVTTTIEIGHTKDSNGLAFTDEERRLIQTLATNLMEVVDKRQQAGDLRLLERALHEVGQAVTITDPEGTIKYVNSAFEEQTGYSKEEVIGTDSRLLQSEHQDEAFYDDLWETIENGDKWHGELINQRNDGSLYYAEQVITPIQGEDGTVSHFVAVETEVTGYRLREQQLDVQNRILHHNLRNALTVFRGYSDNIMEITDNTKIIESVEAINNEVKSLLTVADESAKSRRLLQKEFIPDDVCDLGALLADVENAFRAEYDTVDFSFEYPASVIIKGDDRLKWAIAEIVENAVIHNDRDDPDVSVSATAKDEEFGQFVEVAVTDNGPGIPEHRLPIFKIGKETPLAHGNGIGMWNTYWLVTKVGGSVHIENRDARGTRVTMRFPAPDDHQ